MKSSFVKSILVPAVVVSILTVTSIVYAGSLTAPSGTPSATSYTYDDIYSKLITNIDAIVANHSLSTTTSPASSFHTLTQIYNAIPTIDATKLLSNTTYLGITGSISIKSGDANAASIATTTNKLLLTPAIGYYDGIATVSTTSTAFTASNIANGINLFGITGTLTSGGTGNAGIADVFTGVTFSSSTASNQTGTLTLACATATFDGTSNKVADAYDGTGDGTNRWCMTNSGTATAANIATNTIAWVNGVALTGTLDPYSSQKMQTINDNLCGAATSCTGSKVEYVTEEGTWTAVPGSPFNAGFATSSTPLNYFPVGANIYLFSGTVIQDNRTGLWWSDVASTGSVTAVATTTTNSFTLAGSIGIGDGTRPWDTSTTTATNGNAINFCNALNAINFSSHNDWYLPTQKQLLNAYIDGAVNNLPNTTTGTWSSTEAENSINQAWNVTLATANASSITKTTSTYVRCVRP